MTIREFAQAIGVSTTTVSRAMHGSGRMSDSTRQMVLVRMQELGFTPNLNAQRLSHGRTGLIALDFGHWHDFLADMFFVELTRGVQHTLEERGYGVLLNGGGGVLRRWVHTQAVDGVILIGEPADGKLPGSIAQTGTPCVVIGNEATEPGLCVGSVVVGLRSGASQVADMLVDFRHTEIGYIGADHADEVLHAFRSALERRGIGLCDSRIVLAGHTPHDGMNALTTLLSRSPQPSALFCRTDGLAAGALRAAHRLGLRIPDDLSIVGHDDVPFAELVEPPLTTVRVDCPGLARRACEILFDLLESPAACPAPQTVPTELVIRSSVCRAPAALAS